MSCPVNEKCFPAYIDALRPFEGTCRGIIDTRRPVFCSPSFFRVMNTRLRAAAAQARRVCGAVWTFVAAHASRWRGHSRTKAAPNLLRRLYVFGAVDRSTYQREINRVGRGLKTWRKRR
jgi:hypothetical protein